MVLSVRSDHCSRPTPIILMRRVATVFFFLAGEKGRRTPSPPVMAAMETARWAALVAEGWQKAAKAAEGWRLVAAFTTGYVPIEVWVSPEELLVVHANVSGPLVNSYIVVPTECLSDNGLPHTLEHLCFLGSQDFPFKGVLDKAAFRNLATGN